MKLSKLFFCLAMLSVSFTSGFGQQARAQESTKNNNTTQKVVLSQTQQRQTARAFVRGAPGSGIEGIVFFTERLGNAPEPGVDVVALVGGPAVSLQAGRHGMHVHEVGTCEPNFLAAGGHFDPGPFGNSQPVDLNHPFHMGDIPNLLVRRIFNFAVGRLAHRSSRITLSPGPLSIFDENGSAVIVHLNEDRGVPGETGASGGARIACGVIERVTEEQAESDRAQFKELADKSDKAFKIHDEKR